MANIFAIQVQKRLNEIKKSPTSTPATPKALNRKPTFDRHLQLKSESPPRGEGMKLVGEDDEQAFDRKSIVTRDGLR